MERILIIGSGGAGKSTLALQLKSRLNIPLIHLDAHYWNPNWTETPSDAWKLKVRDLIKPDQWIMDGNYGGTMDVRIDRADTIIFLDRSRWLCMFRVFKRILQYYGSDRPDMGSGCPERFSFEFFRYLYFYPKTRKPKILEKLERIKLQKQVYILTNEQEVQQFLDTL